MRRRCAYGSSRCKSSSFTSSVQQMSPRKRVMLSAIYRTRLTSTNPSEAKSSVRLTTRLPMPAGPAGGWFGLKPKGDAIGSRSVSWQGERSAAIPCRAVPKDRKVKLLPGDAGNIEHYLEAALFAFASDDIVSRADVVDASPDYRYRALTRGASAPHRCLGRLEGPGFLPTLPSRLHSGVLHCEPSHDCLTRTLSNHIASPRSRHGILNFQLSPTLP